MNEEDKNMTTQTNQPDTISSTTVEEQEQLALQIKDRNTAIGVVGVAAALLQQHMLRKDENYLQRVPSPVALVAIAIDRILALFMPPPGQVPGRNADNRLVGDLEHVRVMLSEASDAYFESYARMSERGEGLEMLEQDMRAALHGLLHLAGALTVADEILNSAGLVAVLHDEPEPQAEVAAEGAAP